MQPISIKNGLWKRLLFFGLLNLSVFATFYVLFKGDFIIMLPYIMIYSCTMPFISLLFSKRSIKKGFSFTYSRSK